jgi:hypothetical protein
MLLFELFDYKKSPRDRAIDAALTALHRRATSKGDREDLSGYAFDIARAFNLGITSRELANLYKQRYLNEAWSAKYKRSINCNNPRGFSQRAHCAARKKGK